MEIFFINDLDFGVWKVQPKIHACLDNFFHCICFKYWDPVNFHNSIFFLFKTILVLVETQSFTQTIICSVGCSWFCLGLVFIFGTLCNQPRLAQLLSSLPNCLSCLSMTRSTHTSQKLHAFGTTCFGAAWI